MLTRISAHSGCSTRASQPARALLPQAQLGEDSSVGVGPRFKSKRLTLAEQTGGGRVAIGACSSVPERLLLLPSMDSVQRRYPSRLPVRSVSRSRRISRPVSSVHGPDSRNGRHIYRQRDSARYTSAHDGLAEDVSQVQIHASEGTDDSEWSEEMVFECEGHIRSEGLFARRVPQPNDV